MKNKKPSNGNSTAKSKDTRVIEHPYTYSIQDYPQLEQMEASN